MFDTALFLGFPLSTAYQQELNRLPLVERELFIQSETSPYLQQIENDGVIYLGKSLGASVDMAALDGASSHVMSLLKKLVPNFPYEQHPLVLFAFDESK